MDFIVNVDLNQQQNNLTCKINKINDFIKSKQKELVELEKFRDELIEERGPVIVKIRDIKKNKKLKKEKEIEKKNLISPLFEEMEDNTPVSLHEYSCLKTYLKPEYDENVDDICYELENCSIFKENYVKFGDIVDRMGNRHYGYSFVGKNGILQNTIRDHAFDSECGVTVPFEICKYLTDSVSKYKNLKYNESCIVAYELPYYDVTVQKYDVKKNCMYEYVCWNDQHEEFDFDNWYLEQIDINTGKRTRPKLKIN